MVSGHHLTVPEAVEEYLLAREARYSESTVRNEGHVLRRFAKTVTPRPIQLRNLSADHVESWFLALRREHRDRNNCLRPPISPGTWNFYFARIKAFTEWAARKGHLRHDLLAHLQPMRDIVKVRHQPTRDELAQMLVNTPDPRDRAVLAVAINTGLRSGEIRRLRVGDLDLDGLDLHVWISKSKTQDAMPVTADLAQEMRHWLRCYSTSIGRPVKPDDMLLPTSFGPRIVYLTQPGGTKVRSHVHGGYDPFRPVNRLERIVQSALRATGHATKGEGLHTIRRAVARLMYDRHQQEGHESAIRVVMTLLHHTNQSTTERYLGLSAEREARDLSLRGQPFLTRVPSDNVVALHRA